MRCGSTHGARHARLKRRRKGRSLAGKPRLPKKSSPPPRLLEPACSFVNRLLRPLRRDVALYPYLDALTEVVRSGALVEAIHRAL